MSIILGDSGKTYLSIGDELVGQRVARGGNTVGTRVVSTLNGAVLGASNTVRAKGGVPGVALVAVGRARSGVQPTPVGVQDNGSLSGLTVLSPGELGVDLRGESSDLLRRSESKKVEGSKDGRSELHFD